MQEIQEIQKLIKEQSDKGTLARFDVRDYEFRRVMKKKNRADIVQAYGYEYAPGRYVLQQ